ncbi:alpha/beta hydrolase [Asanoa sp. NPDC050611]|uniref:alpha/beta hydrolase n=1 Tax=Asanoa sp. NPDC050611 TaxID=3157098 RepID=UPI0033CA7DE5
MYGGNRDPARRHTVERRDFAGWPVYRITPRTGESTGELLYLHGGGYVAPIHTVHWDFVARLAGMTGRAVTLPDYPLTPAHNHRDVFPVLGRLYEKVAEGETSSSSFTVMGDSAGATMGLALVQSLPYNRRPGNLILMSPWLDATLTNPEIPAIQPTDPMSTVSGLTELARMWAGPDDLATPELSPINGPLDRLGRVTVFAGSRDILTPDARRLAELATGAAGTNLVLREYEDMTHTWMLTQPGPAADAVLAEITGLLRRYR